jgi:hypothetical protein
MEPDQQQRNPSGRQPISLTKRVPQPNQQLPNSDQQDASRISLDDNNANSGQQGNVHNLRINTDSANATYVHNPTRPIGNSTMRGTKPPQGNPNSPLNNNSQSTPSTPQTPQTPTSPTNVFVQHNPNTNSANLSPSPNSQAQGFTRENTMAQQRTQGGLGPREGGGMVRPAQSGGGGAQSGVMQGRPSNNNPNPNPNNPNSPTGNPNPPPTGGNNPNPQPFLQNRGNPNLNNPNPGTTCFVSFFLSFSSSFLLIFFFFFFRSSQFQATRITTKRTLAQVSLTQTRTMRIQLLVLRKHQN